MKWQINIFISVVCLVCIVYHYIYHSTILGEPYMFWLMITLWGIFGYSLGVGIAKIVKNRQK